MLLSHIVGRQLHGSSKRVCATRSCFIHSTYANLPRYCRATADAGKDDDPIEAPMAPRRMFLSKAEPVTSPYLARRKSTIKWVCNRGRYAFHDVHSSRPMLTLAMQREDRDAAEQEDDVR